MTGSRGVRLLAPGIALALLVLPGPRATAQSVPFACMFGGFISPGSSIEKSCLALNSISTLDVTVWTFVVQDSIRVFDDQNRVVTGPDRDTFIGFFRLSVLTQRVLTSGSSSDGESNDPDLAPLPPSFRGVCLAKRLTDLTGGDDPSTLDQNGCRIGRLRGLGRPYFQREYTEILTMLEEGNQQRFAGWGFQFNEIRRFLVPAPVQDCFYWACDPVGPLGYAR